MHYKMVVPWRKHALFNVKQAKKNEKIKQAFKKGHFSWKKNVKNKI